MKKLLVLLLLSSFVFSYSFDSTVNSSTDEDMIFRMNIQNDDNSRGEYYNTTVPKLGWLNLNGYTTAPVTANMVTGNAVLYYDYTAANPVLSVWFKDVSGNVTNSDIGTTANTVYTFNSTATLAAATFSGAVEINDDITLENDEVISNAANGVIGLTATTVSTNGSINVDGSAVIDGALSAGAVTLTGLIANVTTSSVTVSTGNVNIPVTVNGTLLYIKANTAE